jgi:hypothetical protein
MRCSGNAFIGKFKCKIWALGKFDKDKLRETHVWHFHAIYYILKMIKVVAK